MSNSLGCVRNIPEVRPYEVVLKLTIRRSTSRAVELHVIKSAPTLLWWLWHVCGTLQSLFIMQPRSDVNTKVIGRKKKAVVGFTEYGAILSRPTWYGSYNSCKKWARINFGLPDAPELARLADQHRLRLECLQRQMIDIITAHPAHSICVTRKKNSTDQEFT